MVVGARGSARGRPHAGRMPGGVSMLKFWLFGGLLLVGLEVIVPGGVLAPLGLGALLIALLVWLGVLDQWIPAFTAWFIASLGFILVFRFAMGRIMPGEEEHSPTDEDAAAFDRIVDVTESIAKGGLGRIEFQGSSWPARCYETALPAGAKAKLFYRDGLTWVVTPAGDDPSDPAPTPGEPAP
jgi:inner membrane protein